jgi:hypothetical protein
MHKIFWLGNLKGTEHLENLDVDGIIILKWILGSRVGGFIWLRIGTRGNQLERGKEILCSIKESEKRK